MYTLSHHVISVGSESPVRPYLNNVTNCGRDVRIPASMVSTAASKVTAW